MEPQWVGTEIFMCWKKAIVNPKIFVQQNFSGIKRKLKHFQVKKLREIVTSISTFKNKKLLEGERKS